jgi:hypothetical protein
VAAKAEHVRPPAQPPPLARPAELPAGFHEAFADPPPVRPGRVWAGGERDGRGGVFDGGL